VLIPSSWLPAFLDLILTKVAFHRARILRDNLLLEEVPRKYRTLKNGLGLPVSRGVVTAHVPGKVN
jgi:hypothetical protein